MKQAIAIFFLSAASVFAASPSFNGGQWTNPTITTGTLSGATTNSGTISGGTMKNTSFSGSAISFNFQSTYAPLRLIADGNIGGASEVNEYTFESNNSGNTLGLRNLWSGAPAALKFMMADKSEVGAVGIGGNTGARSLFGEASDIDRDIIGSYTTATPIYLLQTTAFSGSETFAQHIRMLFDTDGTFNLYPRASSAVAALQLTGSDSKLNIGSSVSSFNINTLVAGSVTTSSITPGTFSNFNMAWLWNASGASSSHDQRGMQISHLYSSTANATGNSSIEGLIVAAGNTGAGNIGSAIAILAQINCLNTGTLANGYGGYFASPVNGGPITKAVGLHVDPQKVSGVGTGIGLEVTGTNDASSIAGTLALGGGTPIKKVMSAVATLDFPSTGASAVSDLTVTMTGAADHDRVFIGVPNAAITATASYWAWVSAADTITVRFTPKGTEDPASGSFGVTLVQH